MVGASIGADHGLGALHHEADPLLHPFQHGRSGRAVRFGQVVHHPAVEEPQAGLYGARRAPLQLVQEGCQRAGSDRAGLGHLRTGLRPGDRDGLGQFDITFLLDGADSPVFLAQF